MTPQDKIYVAGHTGLVGSAVVRALRARGIDPWVLAHSELNLTVQADVDRFFAREAPDYVILAAGVVGGIEANRRFGAQFIRDNLLIQANVIHAACRAGAKRVCVLGSSCIYPRLASQPIREDALLTGPLEPTNEPYAVAKIAGLTMASIYARQYATRFVCPMPTNLYGPGDHFNEEHAHVLPAMITKFHKAKLARAPSVTLWGTGMPLREFLYADDLAEAILLLMNSNFEGIINVGSGEEISIMKLANAVADVVGYQGFIAWDTTKPDGTPRKFLDSSRICDLGWRPKVGLVVGLRTTYAWYLEHAERTERVREGHVR